MWKMETNNEIIKKDMSDQKRLYRSNDRILGGVCAGIAEYLDLDPACGIRSTDAVHGLLWNHPLSGALAHHACETVKISLKVIL